MVARNLLMVVSTSPPLADATILRLAGSHGLNHFKLGFFVRGPRRYDGDMTEIMHDSCASRVYRNKTRAGKINAFSVATKN